MELTPRQKLCGLILGLSFGALAVDRFVIGQPGPQSAHAEAVEEKAALTASPAAPAPKPKASAMPSLAARMDAAFGRLPLTAEVGPTRFSDAFGTLGPVQASQTAKAAEAAPAEPTMPECKVTMALNDMARVNDRLMRVGETVNGFTLVSVDQHVVVVQWGETRKEIRIAPELKRHEGKP